MERSYYPESPLPYLPLAFFYFSRRQIVDLLTLTNRSSYLYCLSNPKILIHGGVLRVGSDPIPAVKLLPDPAHLPLQLECLSFIEEATRGIDKFEVVIPPVRSFSTFQAFLSQQEDARLHFKELTRLTLPRLSQGLVSRVELEPLLIHLPSFQRRTFPLSDCNCYGLQFIVLNQPFLAELYKALREKSKGDLLFILRSPSESSRLGEASYLPSISIGGNGNCIGGRGRRSAFYLGSALTEGRFPGTLRFPVTGRIGPVTFVTVGSRNQAFFLSEGLAVNALQANRAESLPSLSSIRVASLLSKAVKGELAAYLLYPRVLARRLVLRAPLLPSPVRSTVQNKAVWSIAKWSFIGDPADLRYMRFFLILRSMALPVITFTRHSRSSILSGGRGLVDKDGHVLVHEANRVAHGKEHVREKDQTSSLRTVSFLILWNTSSSTYVYRRTIHFMKNLRLLAAESLSPLVVGLFSFPRWHEERVHSTSSYCENQILGALSL
ncbi:hypothetical protein V8G54_000072 (mitochondrion) [Vigna mungo]|uniref:Uncharacterized protein n=1 Tax=Vigna mungo TaxID=3915 RepID=A0AAQ3PE50_VIGMU